jgi:hypoxanthine-DNA glycosylase
MKESHPFKPLIEKDSRILILGTFPSLKSFENNFYYSHPKNQFWPILSNIFNVNANTQSQRIELLKNEKIALWDIVKSCERKNSSDSNLKNVEVHDLNDLIKNYPNIKAILFTSKKALYFYQKYHKKINNIIINYLPSPSTAYASMTQIEKAEIYRNILNSI